MYNSVEAKNRNPGDRIIIPYGDKNLSSPGDKTRSSPEKVYNREQQAQPQLIQDPGASYRLLRKDVGAANLIALPSAVVTRSPAYLILILQ